MEFLLLILFVSAGAVLGMIVGSCLGAGVAAVWNLWSVDLGERGMRRKVCGFTGVCLGGFLGAVAGVLYRVL